jgi:putative hydrolase of HD superfamily
MKEEPKIMEDRQKAKHKVKRLADFLFEVGMLRRTPRTGYQFLGSGAENVAEHSFRAAIIGYVLAREAGADPERTALICLFHDLAEARTGDFNYVNKAYNTADPSRAIKDAARGTGLTETLMSFWEELEGVETTEARLAQDADQIDLILNLREEEDLGNARASKWIECAVKRLRTPEGKALAETIRNTDPTDWWFAERDASWWAQKSGCRKK